MVQSKFFMILAGARLVLLYNRQATLLTEGEQDVLHVKPEECHRDEQERRQQGASCERDSHEPVVLRPERLRTQQLDARTHPIVDTPNKF